MASGIKFHIYYSLSSSGPWTQATEEPVEHTSEGHHSYVVLSLEKNTRYYFRIVGGEIIDNEFVPLFSQVITSANYSGTTSLDSPLIEAPFEVVTASGIDMPTYDTLGHMFEIDQII
jgi:hypothetical protein